MAGRRQSPYMRKLNRKKTGQWAVTNWRYMHTEETHYRDIVHATVHRSRSLGKCLLISSVLSTDTLLRTVADKEIHVTP